MVPEIWCVTNGRTDGRKKWHIEMGALPKKKRKNWNDNCKAFCVKRKRNNVTSKGDRQKNKLN